MLTRLKMTAAVLLATLIPAITISAQELLYQPDPDSPIEMRNPAAPVGSEQYDFLIGDWDVEVTLYRAKKAPLVYHAEWHNHWVANGYVVMQEWRGPYTTGIELRSFNAAEGKWEGRNIYQPQPGTWYGNEARLVDSRMIVTTIRLDASGNETIAREIYQDITESSFAIDTQQSADDGITWERGKYRLTATRKGSTTP
jgi:hypothetical protein